MYKHVLLPTDGSALSEVAIQNGLAFAKAIGAKVTGLYVTVERPVESFEDFAPVHGIANIPTLLGVHEALPVRTVEELVSHAKAKPGEAAPVDAISFTLARTGTRSTYGRIRVTKAGIAKPLFEARGIAVYTDVAARVVTIPIPPEVAAQLAGPTRVEYLEDIDTGGGMIAEAQVVIR